MASITIAENTPPATLVTTIAAPIHPDDGMVTVLGMINGVDSSTYFDFQFEADGSISVYSTATAFDFESPPTVDHFYLQVFVYADGSTYDVPVSLTVTDDAAPVGLNLIGNTVAEDAAPGAVVGTLSATDAEGQSLTYTLTDDAAGKFEIVGNELRVKAGLDHEIAAEHAVTVQVSDGENQVSQTFTIGVSDVAEPGEELGTITIDASGANGMNLEALIRGGFVAGETGGGFPSFDNSGNFDGEEMFIGYGTDAASKYVLAHGDLAYGFSTHTIHGTINTLEFGTRGTGSFDANGYFVGGASQLKITGLDFSNALPTNATEEAEIEANGLVHLFGIAHMYGDATGTPNEQRVLDALAKVADGLDLYAQNFIGSAGADLYAGTAFNDTIKGGGGNDVFDGGGGGQDVAIFNGTFADYTIIRNGDGSTTVTDNVTSDGDDGTDTLSNIEALRFADSQHYTGSSGADTYVGIDLSDVIEGGAGDDNLNGGAGEDTAIFSGNFADYQITGNVDGTITVEGADGTDTLRNIEKLRFADGVQDAPANAAPTAPTFTGKAVPENSPAGTVVGSLAATDPEGGAVTYELTDDGGGLFVLDGNQVKLARPMGDFETATNRTHSFTVVAKDAAGNTTPRTFSIENADAFDAPEGTLTIDARGSGAAGVDFNTFIADYFAGLASGAYNFYGGTPDQVGPSTFYLNGDQIAFKYKEGGVDDVSDRVVLGGQGLAYDFFHHGSQYGHGISGSVDSLTFGQWGPNTTGTEGTGSAGLIQNLIEQVKISGLDLQAAKGTTQAAANLVHALYNALLAGDAAAINAVLSNYAQNFVGSAGNDSFTGSRFADTIDGGAGADRLAGGLGDDVYKVDNAGDVVTEAADAGVDTVQSSVNHTLAANVENLTLIGSAVVGTGNALNNVITGNALANTLNGGGGSDRLVGGAGNDIYITEGGDTIVEAANGGTDTVQSSVNHTLGSNLENLTLVGAALIGVGNTLNNVVTGNALANTLNGGGGADRLVGGAGNDTYITDGGDTIVEAANGGTDTVQSSVNYTLGANLENLTLTGTAVWGTGNTLNNVISGNAANNVLNGGGGADRLVGGVGNDTYVTEGGDVIVEAANAGTDTVQSSVNYTLGANLENLTLTGSALVGNGNTLNNVITGNALANALNGGGGADRLVGGAGNDTYITDGGDTIVEAANAGTDTVQSSVNYTLGANLENLTLTGSALVGTGNTLNNVITGNALANTLNGGGGADRLVGGVGNDTYITDGGDTIVEAANAGTDTVRSSVNYTLGANLENLTLTGSAVVGTGNALNNVITGNALANMLNGGAGADRLVGGAGNDTYYVDNARDIVVEVAGQGTDRVISSVNYTLAANVENLTLTGSAVWGTGNTLNNIIAGNALANTLNGGTGADRLVGGAGNDTYITDGGDTIVEAANAGTDTVRSSVDYTLGANLENLTLTGSAVVGTGNALNNVITGNALANMLNGGAGADRLVGGAGNDTYYVDNARDIVVEVAGQGTDRVISSVNYTLAANVENLTLAGAAIWGTGNALNNVVVGTAGNNVLAGGLGNDTLTGGAGSDTFLFNTALNRATNVDRITDFNVAADTIRLDNAVFKGMGEGWLAAGAFHTGAGAADAHDRIVYNKTTGALSYDADGSGSGAAVHFATVSAGLALTNADFFVI